MVINKSQKPIDSLNVPMLFYTSIPFAERFPQLRYLTLKPKHRNWVDKEVYLPELFVDDPAHVSNISFRTGGGESDIEADESSGHTNAPLWVASTPQPD